MPYKNPADEVERNKRRYAVEREATLVRVTAQRLARRNPCPTCGSLKDYRSELCKPCRSAETALMAKGKEQDIARRALHKAEAIGRITRPKSCSTCGSDGPIEAHHHNGYSPEHRLDVVFLCAPCHREMHGKRR